MRFRKRPQAPTTVATPAPNRPAPRNVAAGPSTKIANTDPKRRRNAPPQGKRSAKNVIKVNKRIYPERQFTFDNFDDVKCTYQCFLDGGDHPAINDPNTKTKKWYKMGVIHRDNGPAITSPDGEEWYTDGKLHRLDGPAVISQKRGEQFWINGVQQTI